jgi:alcohol dehydrogenase class IV
MSCAHAYVPEEGGEGIFAIDASSLTFGRGALREVGAHVRALGCRRVAVFTDARVAKLEWPARACGSLREAGIDFAVYDAVHVEPTDASFLDAARFASEGRFDGYVSIGGGSVIDTCKAASLYASFPRDFLAYVNKPVGAGEPVPGALPPHVACPTTSGTGSELTGIAVCDVLALRAKTGIASRRLRPSLAVVDPDVTATLPSTVVAASGFDVLCHALESYTARPFCARAQTDRASPAARPMSQGRNPWSDLGSLEALRLSGAFLVRAVRDASDAEARAQMMWAATLAGVAFGNSGVHVPHAMAYAVAGLVRAFTMPGYPEGEPLVPHGVSVVVNAPAVFRWTATACASRHLEAASRLGARARADARGARDEDAGELVARALEGLMREAGVPVGLASLGYDARDFAALVGGTIVQRRLLDNAPRDVGEADLACLFAAALHGADGAEP